MSRFQVRIARPVFQTTTVIVEAETEEEAGIEALREVGDSLKDRDWNGEFDRDAYGYDIQSIYSEADGDAEPGEDLFPQVNYVLLKADMSSAEGGIVLQPWMVGAPTLFLADVGMDWSNQLDEFHQSGLDRFFDYASRQVSGDAFMSIQFWLGERSRDGDTPPD